MRFFVPHGGQKEFLNKIDGGFIVVTGAGNGWGKSEIIAALFASAMWPEQMPDGFPKSFKNWKFPKRARIYSGPAELEEIGSLQTAIKKLFPKGRYTFSKGRYGYPSIFASDTGWILDMFSYERDAKEAAGPNIGLQAFNEPPPEDLFREGIARTRSGGYIVGGFTSLLDNIWVVDGIFNKQDGKNIRVRYGSSCENCKTHGKDGHLDHEQIEKILSQYDEDEREARFSGKPLSMSGRIFKSFSRNIHVAEEDIIPPSEGVSVGMSVDPAIGKPMAILWRYVDAQGILNYFDEYPNFEFQGAKDGNLTIKEYVDLIIEREHGLAVDQRIIDRHFSAARRTNGGKTLMEEFAEAGMDFSPSYTMDEEIETGIAKIKEYLRYDKTQPISNLNQPKIRISPKCKNLIAALERWGRNPKTGKPAEEYKDFIDCLRYDVMSEPMLEIGSTWKAPKQPYYGVS